MAGQGKIAVNDADLIGISSFELRQHGRKLGAVRSLEVAVFNESDGSALRTDHPVVFGDAKDGF